VEHLRAQSGRHFDPDMVEVFIAQLPAFVDIKNRWPD
jgi:putative two-component system response regulator